jgi:hypothetical protein
LEKYFTAFPDFLVNEDLAPSPSPIALAVVTGNVVPADVIARQVARRCSDFPNWKWEAVPHVDMQFLVSIHSFDDLDMMDGIQVGVSFFSVPRFIFLCGDQRRCLGRDRKSVAACRRGASYSLAFPVSVGCQISSWQNC